MQSRRLLALQHLKEVESETLSRQQAQVGGTRKMMSKTPSPLSPPSIEAKSASSPEATKELLLMLLSDAGVAGGGEGVICSDKECENESGSGLAIIEEEDAYGYNLYDRQYDNHAQENRRGRSYSDSISSCSTSLSSSGVSSSGRGGSVEEEDAAPAFCYSSSSPNKKIKKSSAVSTAVAVARRSSQRLAAAVLGVAASASNTQEEVAMIAVSPAAGAAGDAGGQQKSSGAIYVPGARLLAPRTLRNRESIAFLDGTDGKSPGGKRTIIK
jgi:hypothetical protein